MYQEFKCDFFRKARGMMALLSFLLVACTCYTAWEAMDFKIHSYSTVGKVIGFEQEFRNGRKYLFPVVRFWDQQGIPHMSRSNLATIYGGVHKVGDSFSLIYRYQNPESIRENTMLGVFGKLVMAAIMTYMNLVLLLIFHCYLNIGLEKLPSKTFFSKGLIQ